MKQHKRNNNFFIKTIACFCAVLILTLYINIAPTKASVLSDAVLDSGNAAERQFWEKVKIIKSVFPSQIDDVALAATVLYNGSSSGILSEQYDENFDSNKFKERIEGINQAKDSIEDNPNQDYERPEGEQVDILIAATIVMLDSSGWTGTYSDESYEKALAGDGLVGNMSDEGDIFADAFDSVFCKAGELLDPIANPIFDTILGTNDKGYGTNRTAMRYYNMQNICDNGFIGGTIENVRLINNKEQQAAKKRSIAKEIIKLAETYRKIFGEDSCIYQSVGSGDATNWRQGNAPWSTKTLGHGGQTVAEAGCTSTSMAYLIQKSGTALLSNNFDPGVFVDSASYQNSNLVWDSWIGVAPNFKMNKQNINISNYTADTVASVIEKELNTPTNLMQTFVIIYMTGHWVAVDHVENGVVYVMDPSADEGVGLVTLEKALNRGNVTRSLISYNTFSASDVPAGSVGPSNIAGGNKSANYCNGAPADGLSTDLGEGTRIDVPDPCPLRSGGTMRQSGISFDDVEFPNFTTACKYTTALGDVCRAWQNAGKKSENGLAVLDGRYIAATSSMFGKIGDAVDVVLANGKVIKLIVADVKGSDAPSVWGHQQLTYSNNKKGISMVEWEGYNGYSSTQLPKTYSDWHEQTIQYVINYGSYLKRLS